MQPTLWYTLSSCQFANALYSLIENYFPGNPSLAFAYSRSWWFVPRRAPGFD